MKSLRKLFLIGIPVFLTGSILIAYSFTMEKPEKETPRSQTPEKPSRSGSVILKDNIQLITVRNEDRTIKYQITGRVIPKNSTQIFAEVQGRILPGKKEFKEGTKYYKGENLVQIDSKEFYLNLESQKSVLLNLLTGIMPDLKADYPDNYETWLAYIKSYQTGENLAPLPVTLSDAEKYYITSNQVYSTYYAIKALEERLNKYTIAAPYHCMLTDARVDVGGLVLPGQALGTIIHAKQYELEAGVKADIISLLELGDRIKFTSNDIEGQWTGSLSRINQIIDEKTQNIPVYFAIGGPSIKSGLYLEGTLNTQTYEGVFCIPSKLLSRNNQVNTLQKDVIRTKSVKPVAFLRDSILVKGLMDGDKLIANQFQGPVEGKKITQ